MRKHSKKYLNNLPLHPAQNACETYKFKRVITDQTKMFFFKLGVPLCRTLFGVLKGQFYHEGGPIIMVQVRLVCLDNLRTRLETIRKQYRLYSYIRAAIQYRPVSILGFSWHIHGQYKIISNPAYLPAIQKNTTNGDPNAARQRRVLLTPTKAFQIKNQLPSVM